MGRRAAIEIQAQVDDGAQIDVGDRGPSLGVDIERIFEKFYRGIVRSLRSTPRSSSLLHSRSTSYSILD